MKLLQTAGQVLAGVAVLALVSQVAMLGNGGAPLARGACVEVCPPGIEPAQVSAPAAPVPAGEIARADLPPAVMPEAPRAVLALGRTALGLGAATPDGLLADIGCTATAMDDRDAIELVLAGRAAFAVVGQQPSAHDLGAGLRGTLLGVELWSLAVPAGSPLTSLRTEQVRAVLTGQARTWQELGFQGGAITLVVPDERQAAERAARALLPGDALAAAAMRVAGDDAVLDQVARVDGALGVVRAAVAERSPAVRLLRLEGVAPSFAAFAQGQYPAGVPLVVVAAAGAPAAAAQRYADAVRASPGAGWLTLP
jgi:hypothetical protein